MARFLPEDFIEEVRGQNDIADVVSEYLALKPSGKGFFALCPFHSEKTPSFHVYPERQIYHCFGCGVGGNVFSFIMAIENIGFVDAVKMLAERVGMSLPETYDAKQHEERMALNDQMYNINTQVARFYHKQLISEEGKQALDYLKSRQLDMSIIRKFGLGFAPDAWDATKEYLKDLGFEEKQLLEAGIIVESKGRSYDRFRNRIMFPIINQSGYVVGFGGRVMDDSVPKYLNTAESPVFNKSNVLFGLNLARKQRPLTEIIVVEGYMDVITLYQYGYYNAVATLGTALTLEQAGLIRRYAGKAIIAYDGDAAGRRAALRAIDALTRAGCDVQVVIFPKGMDPDDIISEYGKAYFDKLLVKSVPATEFELELLKEDYDLETQDGKIEYVTAAAEILSKVENVLERDVYINHLEELTGFRSELIYRQIDVLNSKNKRKSVKKDFVGNNRHISVNIGNKPKSSHIIAERDLINLMVQNEAIAKKVRERLGDYEFQVDIHQEIIDIIDKILEDGGELNVAQIFNYVHDSEKSQQIIEIFSIQNEYDNMDKYINDCINRLEKYKLKRDWKEIQAKIAEMEKGKVYDLEKYRQLIEKAQELNRRILILERERRE